MALGEPECTTSQPHYLAQPLADPMSTLGNVNVRGRVSTDGWLCMDERLVELTEAAVKC